MEHGFICNWVENVKRGVSAEISILTNLKAADCCKTPTNEKLIYFPAKSCKLQKCLGRLKIWFLKSIAVRENTRLIA